MPVGDGTVDLFISRRGPTHWLADVPRVAKETAVLIQLNPMPPKPRPWNDELPEKFRVTLAAASSKSDWPTYIENSLKTAGIKLHSYWIFDVPELFDSVREYYTYLCWGYDPKEVPPFAECRQQLENIFAKYGDSQGLDVRARRFLWKAEYQRGRRKNIAPIVADIMGNGLKESQ